MLLFFVLSIVQAQEPEQQDPVEQSTSQETPEKTEVPSTEPSQKENADPLVNPPEMIVFGEREVDVRRQKLENQLYAEGYREGIKKEGRTVYRPETSWKPSVVVYESGFIELKRTPPRFESYLKHRNDIWRYLACVPPFALMCIDVNGWLINERKLRHAKEDIVINTHDDIIAWQKSLEQMNMEERINNTIPLMLDAVWKKGLLPDGRTISDSQEKLQWVFTFYSERLCNEYGILVRDVIETYIEKEISVELDQNFPQQKWEEIKDTSCIE